MKEHSLPSDSARPVWRLLCSLNAGHLPHCPGPCRDVWRVFWAGPPSQCAYGKQASDLLARGRDPPGTVGVFGKGTAAVEGDQWAHTMCRLDRWVLNVCSSREHASAIYPPATRPWTSMYVPRGDLCRQFLHKHERQKRLSRQRELPWPGCVVPGTG